MKTNVITVDEAIKNGSYKWNKCENDCDFYGIVSGYICGWCLEYQKNGEIGYGSMTCTNDYEEIINSEYDWNSLGISAQCASYNGWEPTGNIVFRGYYTEDYDYDEREEYVDEVRGDIDLSDFYEDFAEEYSCGHPEEEQC